MEFIQYKIVKHLTIKEINKLMAQTFCIDMYVLCFISIGEAVFYEY